MPSLSTSQELGAGDFLGVTNRRLSSEVAGYAVLALYFLSIFSWCMFTELDSRDIVVATIMAAVATAIGATAAAVAALDSWHRHGDVQRTPSTLAAGLVAATAIAQMVAVIVNGAHLWASPLLLWMHAIAGPFMLLALAWRTDATGWSIAGLAKMASLLSMSLSLAAVIGLAVGVDVDELRAGTMSATGVALASAVAAAVWFVANRETNPSVSSLASAVALTMASWGLAVAAQTVAIERASFPAMAFGHLLELLGAAGVVIAARLSIRLRGDDASGREEWHVWDGAGDGLVVFGLLAALAAAAVALIFNLGGSLDVAVLALCAAAAFGARQSIALRSTESRVLELIESSEELERIANEDPGTGLPNRAALDDRLAEEFERSVRYDHPLSVCVVDVDHFKRINDTFGHAIGDIVLREVGKCLRNAARTVDFVARYGGEEFVVVAPDTWTYDAMILAERLRLRVERLVFAAENGQLLRVTVSVGVAGYPEHADDLALLFDRADAALYRSKANGRNRVSLFTGDEVMA